MLYTAIRRFGNKEDFIGHIGGDDFVFITTPEKYKGICQNFILMFDRIIPFHYSAEDRKQGFVVARDRAHKVKRTPLMSVSMAVANRKNPSEFKNIIEINEKVVEIKQYLKSILGSKFMADRRNRKAEDLQDPQIYKKDENLLSTYKPLGQILLENNAISPEQLDEALKIHWKRGILLGEILKELGFIKEEELKEGLDSQKANLIIPAFFDTMKRP